MKLPKNSPSASGPPPQSSATAESISDDQLAELYAAPQEASTIEGKAIAEQHALLTNWLSAPLADSTRETLRSALVRELPHVGVSASHTAAQITSQSVDLIPLNGVVWIRRNGARVAIPVTAIHKLEHSTRIVAPAGSRAQVHYSDGSLLLLDGDTELEVLSADTPRTTSPSLQPASATLHRGRIFAWVARQSSGRFAVNTAHGPVSVLGTEFDVHHKSDDSLQIVVAEGHVRFDRQQSLSSPDQHTDGISLRAGDALNVPSDSAPSRPPLVAHRLTRRELQAQVSWARTGNPSTGQLIRANAMLKLVIIIAIIGFFVALLLKHSSSASTPIAPQSSTSTTATLAQSVTSTPPTIPHPSTGGPEFLANVEVEAKQGQNFVKIQQFQAGQRLVEALPDGTRIIEATLRSEKSLVPSPAGKIDRLVGKPVRYTVSPDGQISDIRLPLLGAAPDSAAAITFLEMIRHAWMLLPDPNAQGTSSTIGQQTEKHANGSLPGLPKCKFTFASTLKYEGPATSPTGQPANKHSYKGTGTIGALTLREDNRNGRINRISIAEYRSEETGDYQTDANGHTISATIVEHRTITPAQTTEAPNTQPFTRNLPPTFEERRVTVTAGGQK